MSIGRGGKGRSEKHETRRDERGDDIRKKVRGEDLIQTELILNIQYINFSSFLQFAPVSKVLLSKLSQTE